MVGLSLASCGWLRWRTRYLKQRGAKWKLDLEEKGCNEPCLALSDPPVQTTVEPSSPVSLDVSLQLLFAKHTAPLDPNVLGLLAGKGPSAGRILLFAHFCGDTVKVAGSAHGQGEVESDRGEELFFGGWVVEKDLVHPVWIAGIQKRSVGQQQVD